MPNLLPYKGSLTMEQFLFLEMRTTAGLMAAGKSNEDIVQEVFNQNLYQYPTERVLKKIARVCIKRLEMLGSSDLVAAVVQQPAEVAKQICLYAMMKQQHLVWDFMVYVIGEKFATHNFAFAKSDVNVFFEQLQERDERVAGWSEATINKQKQVLVKLLVDNGYLGNIKATVLQPVLLSSMLEKAIRNNGDADALSAFNCFD